MKAIKNSIILLTLGFLFFTGNRFLSSQSPTDTVDQQVLEEVLDSAFQLMQEDSLYLRQRCGLKVEKLPEFTYEKAESQIAKIKRLLEKLQNINLTELSYENTITLRTIEWVMKNQVEEFRFYWLKIPIAPYSSPIPELNRLFTSYEFAKKEDPEQYLELLKQYPTAISQIHAILQEQFRKKIIFPQEGLQPIIDYCRLLLQPAEKSFLFVTPERLKKDGIFKNSTEADAFNKKMAEIIATKINPTLEKLLSFIKGDYYKAAPAQVGLWQYPGGAEFYNYLVKTNTEQDISPAEIHRIGLEQIEILKKKLDEVRQKVQFAGDLDAFLHYLQTEPQFKLNSAAEMEERMKKFMVQAEKLLPRFFIKIPVAPCDVKRLELELEGSMTYGFYQPPMPPEKKGYYFYNGSNPGEKNRLNMASAALILHELLPGHHFQGTRQSEIKNLHPLMKEMFNTAYGEGWAEYASSLGEEMGLYQDPYEQCGRIMEDLFVTVRLVVDTGMNYYHWPRLKAKEMMKKYLLTTDREIESETLRYSTGMPAQALAYKMGHLKFQELRKKVQQALGPNFDIREFHETILANGSMPLFLLEKHIQHFINSKQ